jgi:hypothetical protein
METLICAVCGYQWDVETTGLTSTFELDCPVCEANQVHRYSAEKERIMGANYDGLPWY